MAGTQEKNKWFSSIVFSFVGDLAQDVQSQSSNAGIRLEALDGFISITNAGAATGTIDIRGKTSLRKLVPTIQADAIKQGALPFGQYVARGSSSADYKYIGIPCDIDEDIEIAVSDSTIVCGLTLWGGMGIAQT